jgi:hypothetical protein
MTSVPRAPGANLSHHLMSSESKPKRHPEICIYCAKNPGVTDDHVPPKSFFPQPRPSNLITVPACNKWNSGAGKDDDYFLATFMFSEAGITDAGKTLWRQRVHRMFSKNLGLRRKNASGLSHRRVATPSGIYLGRRMALQFDERRFDRVVQKIVRGLYYFEYGETLPADAEVMTLFLSTKARYETAVGYANQLDWGKKRWPGIFEYRCGRVPGAPQQSVWLMRCYGITYFWAISGSDEASNKDGG